MPPRSQSRCQYACHHSIIVKRRTRLWDTKPSGVSAAGHCHKKLRTKTRFGYHWSSENKHSAHADRKADRTMNSFIPTNAWLTTANVLYLASYLVHDILWLRVLSIIGAAFIIEYYYLQPTPLTAAIAWNIGFCAINAVWIARLIFARRPVHLTDDEEHLREIAFPSLTRRETLNLYGLGTWENVPPGASLVEHDRRGARFSVIFSGTAVVTHRGITVAQLGEGQFIGDIDRRADERADMDVVVRTPTRVMCWRRAILQAFLDKRPDVALALERSVGLQLRRLLDRLESSLQAP